MTAFELLERMSSTELTYWWAYNNIKADEQKMRELDQRAKENLRRR